MSVRSNNSRERILEVAEALILKQGFGGTSIDDLLVSAAITKGGFFYHFEGKSDLAKALVERYLAQDALIFSGLFQRADSLSEDPLHRLLIFLKLFAEAMQNLEVTHPGCLVASFTYESHHLDEDIQALIKQGVLSWRTMISERLLEVTASYPSRVEISIPALADVFTTAIEGGVILSRIMGSNDNLVEQVLAYRTHLRLLFES